MTNPTPAQMSEYLAKHLLGWTRVRMLDEAVYMDNGTPVSISGGLLLNVDGWHPHDDISQCFEYLIPAMEDSGWYWYLNDKHSVPRMHFARDSFLGKRYCSSQKDEALAITEACYLAVKAQEDAK